MPDWVRILLSVQGIYFLVTGAWPIVHLKSFEAVSGHKTDDWLVKTVGALITVIAVVLLVAAARDAASLEVGLLAAGSAAALLVVDVVYATNGTIPKVYLYDAVPEVAFILAWTLAA